VIRLPVNTINAFLMTRAITISDRFLNAKKRSDSHHLGGVRWIANPPLTIQRGE
jgi:hypothetical protein